MDKKTKSHNDEIEFYQANDGYEDDNSEFSLYDEEIPVKQKKGKSKRMKPKGKKGKKEPTRKYDNYTFSEEDFSETEDERLAMERKRIYRKIKITAGAVIYILFLMVGIFSTTYNNIDGVPQKIGVSLREARTEFYMTERHFNQQLSVIYEVKRLDDEVEKAGGSQSFIYAVNYKNYEAIIESSVKDVQGAGYSGDYGFMRDINIVIYDNLFKYVNMMSDGLSSQNMTYIQEAQQYKKNYMTAFEKYTTNLEQFRSLVGLDERD